MDTQELKFVKASFVKSGTKPDHYPPAELPEIAVMGRSNVGKSSLMNSLFNRKNLVKVSNTPGRTQLINFFLVDDALSVVDLPGYGYAKVPPKIRKQWRPMIETYLTSREALIGCLLLFDIRRIPNDDDLDLWVWLRHFGFTVIPVITKSDKLSAQKGRNQLKRIANVLEVPLEALVVTSSKTHKGRDKLRKLMSGLCWDFTPPEPEEMDETEGPDESEATEDNHTDQGE